MEIRKDMRVYSTNQLKQFRPSLLHKGLRNANSYYIIPIRNSFPGHGSKALYACLI